MRHGKARRGSADSHASCVHADRHLRDTSALKGHREARTAQGCRASSSGFANHWADGTAARLWRTRWWSQPTRSTVQPVGAARHSLVLLGFGRERATQRSEVVRALETKFLRFWTGQEQDTCPVRFRLRLPLSAPGFWRAWCGSFLAGAAVATTSFLDFP